MNNIKRDEILLCCIELCSRPDTLYGGFYIVVVIYDNRPTHKHQDEHMFNVERFIQLDNPHTAWRIGGMCDYVINSITTVHGMVS